MRLAVITALAALAPCAALAAPRQAMDGPDACFSGERIQNHKIADARTLYLETDRRGVFRVTMANGCLTSATTGEQLGLRHFGKSRVCKPADLDLSVRGRRCVAQSIVRMSPAEVAALPAKHRP